MPKKSKFDLSHERKMSFNMGKLIPFMVEEVLPGDSFRVNNEVLVRLAPMLAPVMHRVNIYLHNFFVPMRLIWNESEDFFTGGRDGSLEPLVPFIDYPTLGNLEYNYNGSLADYLGLPTGTTGSAFTNPMKTNVLAFRAYLEIYNEWYRDPNLTDPVPYSKNSGASIADWPELGKLRDRAWEKDYFTSCLPFAQRGQPVGAPIDYVDVGSSLVKTGSDGSPAPDGQLNSAGGVAFSNSTGVRIESEGRIMVETMRLANRMQEWYERNARSGSRYIEQLLGQWGVRSSDARLQRPEYLGGGRQPVVISEVVSTFQADASVAPYPQGNMAGHGISAGSNNGFKRRFEEHGFVIGILSVLPRTAYHQGLHRKWTRFDKFDYAWPAFANLGEQEVNQREIFADYEGPLNPNPPVFGYQERYAEYKYGCSTVHGEFRDSLGFWTMGRNFTAAPVLNESFVMSDPTHRIFAVEDPTIHKLYAQCYNSISAIRSLPFYGTPRI